MAVAGKYSIMKNSKTLKENVAAKFRPEIWRTTES